MIPVTGADLALKKVEVGFLRARPHAPYIGNPRHNERQRRTKRQDDSDRMSTLVASFRFRLAFVLLALAARWSSHARPARPPDPAAALMELQTEQEHGKGNLISSNDAAEGGRGDAGDREDQGPGDGGGGGSGGAECDCDAPSRSALMELQTEQEHGKGNLISSNDAAEGGRGDAGDGEDQGPGDGGGGGGGGAECDAICGTRSPDAPPTSPPAPGAPSPGAPSAGGRPTPARPTPPPTPAYPTQLGECNPAKVCAAEEAVDPAAGTRSSDGVIRRVLAHIDGRRAAVEAAVLRSYVSHVENATRPSAAYRYDDFR